MKCKIIPLLFFGILVSTEGFSQDTTRHFSYDTAQIFNPPNSDVRNFEQNKNATNSGKLNRRNKNGSSYYSKHHIYRDSRLGSSSPLYNTYKKNDYGAGAVTTNPKKDV